MARPMNSTRVTAGPPDTDRAALRAISQRYEMPLSWPARRVVAEFQGNRGPEGAHLGPDLPPEDGQRQT